MRLSCIFPRTEKVVGGIWHKPDALAALGFISPCWLPFCCGMWIPPCRPNRPLRSHKPVEQLLIEIHQHLCRFTKPRDKLAENIILDFLLLPLFLQVILSALQGSISVILYVVIIQFKYLKVYSPLVKYYYYLPNASL